MSHTAIAIIVVTCTVYALRRVTAAMQRVYDAGRVTGYAQGTLERR